MKFPSILKWIIRYSVIIFFAGNVLLLILIIISGGSNSYPISRFYWVEGDTSGIPHAPNITRWTYWGACPVIDRKAHCGGTLGPAYPISPVDNFETRINVPQKFISRRSAMYYLSRLAFSFFWIALSFIGISFLIYAGSWFSRGASHVTWVLTFFGCLFNILAVVLQTAAAVMARDAFIDAERYGRLGASLFGMAWTSVFLCLVELASVIVGHFWDTIPKIRRRTAKEDQNNYEYERTRVPLDRVSSHKSIHPFRSILPGASRNRDVPFNEQPKVEDRLESSNFSHTSHRVDRNDVDYHNNAVSNTNLSNMRGTPVQQSHRGSESSQSI